MTFLNSNKIWLLGTIIGLVLSVVGICKDMKIINIIGTIIIVGASMYQAYSSWDAQQWHEE